jgi:hypothetical protein
MSDEPFAIALADVLRAANELVSTGLFTRCGRRAAIDRMFRKCVDEQKISKEAEIEVGLSQKQKSLPKKAARFTRRHKLRE